MTKAQNSKGKYEIATAYKTGLAITKSYCVAVPTTAKPFDEIRAGNPA